jgi:hypothetical protein
MLSVSGEGNRLDRVPFPADIATPAARGRCLRQVRHRRASVHRPALAGGGTMDVGLHAAARDYVSEHRARGYRLDDHERLLGAVMGA